MRTPEYSNWVAGRPCPTAAEEHFERRSHLAPFEATGRWPRSSAADLVGALEATGAAAQAWRARPRAERVELLRGVPAALASHSDLAAELSGALGLEAQEFAARLDLDLHSLAESLEIAADGQAQEPPGAGLFVAHWSDLVGGLAARVCARLMGGAGVCVLADPHLPAAGEALGRALAATLGPGPWSILHSDLRDPGSALLERAELAWVRWRAPREVLTRVLQGGGTGGPGRPADIPATWQLWPVSNSSHAVLEGSDPALEAARVVEKALGRSGTLSGQFPGQVGRIYCHQKLFSRFAEQLLDLLEGSPDACRPVPLVEDDLFEHVHRVWTIGLDEGATPIFGGPPERFSRVPQPGLGGDGTARRAPQTLQPLVFTNVDGARDLVRLDRPAPVLGLCRVASDGEARRLCRAADGAAVALRSTTIRGIR